MSNSHCKILMHLKSDYCNLSDRFVKKNADYKKQYCKIYGFRLGKMTTLLQERIKKKWGDQYPVVSVHKLVEQHKKCIIIGTLFKDQKLKPSVLKKLAENNSLVPQPVYTHFTDDSDMLFIEDELQRYEVYGEIDVHAMVTGITCAILGADEGKGRFHAEDYCFADCRPQFPRLISQHDRFVIFMSGLDLMHSFQVQSFLNLFTVWAIGACKNTDAKNSSHLIIAGNCIGNNAETNKQASIAAKTVISPENVEAVVRLDKWLSKFAAIMDVHLMPGLHDPSNHILAQQPLHNCLFPICKRLPRYKSVTNPYEFEIEGVRILGTSGQPVTDIMCYSRIEDPLTALEKCLTWNHIAPTAPDTLGSFPYYDSDPFIIENCPHVLFAGNQPNFQTKMFTGPDGQAVRLICIPQFSTSGEAVKLNLRTLECQKMHFRIGKFTVKSNGVH